MQKTKLGLSVTFVAACLYFFGLFSAIPAVLLVAYVLLKEEDEWLKKMAVKALILVLVFWIAGGFLSAINEVFSFLSVIVGWFGGGRVAVPLNLTNLVAYALDAIEILVMLVLGLQALKHESMPLGPIDGMVDSAMGVAKAVVAKVEETKAEEVKADDAKAEEDTVEKVDETNA